MLMEETVLDWGKTEDGEANRTHSQSATTTVIPVLIVRQIRYYQRWVCVFAKVTLSPWIIDAAQMSLICCCVHYTKMRGSLGCFLHLAIHKSVEYVQSDVALGVVRWRFGHNEKHCVSENRKMSLVTLCGHACVHVQQSLCCCGVCLQ